MNNKVKEAISIFAEYAEATRKQYQGRYDIRASVDFGDTITLRISAFKIEVVSIVALQHLDIRTPEDSEGIYELQKGFDAQMLKLVDTQKAALLARKRSLEAELAAVNEQLDK